MALNLAKTVIAYLQARPGEKFTARQIASWIFATYPEQCEQKRANSLRDRIRSDADLMQQLVAEIGSSRQRIQAKCSAVKTTEGKPRKYYYSEQSDSAEVAATEDEGAFAATDVNISIPDERTLYTLLPHYLRDEFGVFCKRIDEKHASNKCGPNGNRWLYPDMVGMEDFGADWHREVRDCVKQYSDKRTRLWSFEVKRLINRSNVRECFFQAVSNSSWANFGYLVAAEINGQDTLKELRMLFAAHGIGVIKLDVENPADSQVLIPARERSEIDWNMVNRLAMENLDFMAYVKLVRQFYQTGEVRSRDWDASKDED